MGVCSEQSERDPSANKTKLPPPGLGCAVVPVLLPPAPVGSEFGAVRSVAVAMSPRRHGALTPHTPLPSEV